MEELPCLRSWRRGCCGGSEGLSDDAAGPEVDEGHREGGDMEELVAMQDAVEGAGRCALGELGTVGERCRGERAERARKFVRTSGEKRR